MFSLINRKMSWDGLILSEMRNVEELYKNTPEETYRITRPDNSSLDIPLGDLSLDEHKFFEAFIDQFLLQEQNFISELQRSKEQKIQQLDEDCTKNIYNGFSSSAFDGVTYKMYDFDERDQDNLVALLAFTKSDVDSQMIYFWKAKGELEGYVWNSPQIQKMCLDAYFTKAFKMQTYHSLREAVNACTRIEDVEAIMWEDI